MISSLASLKICHYCTMNNFGSRNGHLNFSEIRGLHFKICFIFGIRKPLYMFFISCNFFCSMITYISEKMKNKKTSYIWYSKNIEMFCKDISSDINLLYLKGMQFLQIFKVAAFGIKNVHSLLLHEIFYQCIYFQKILSTSSVHSNSIL